jgi:hypothetical protein
LAKKLINAVCRLNSATMASCIARASSTAGRSMSGAAWKQILSNCVPFQMWNHTHDSVSSLRPHNGLRHCEGKSKELGGRDIIVHNETPFICIHVFWGRTLCIGNDREIIIAVGVGTLEANTMCGWGQFNVLLRVCSETCTTAGGAT